MSAHQDHDETMPDRAGRPVAALRTALFVPGSRPDRFAKAAAAGADAVIIDLEDAVAPEDKSSALQATIAALESGELAALVRINGVSTPTHAAEVSALARVASQDGLVGVVLPKAESPDEIRSLAAALGPAVPIVALIESARGLVGAAAIAGAGAARLALGAIDLSVDLDAEIDAVIDYARIQLVVASRLAGLPGPIDSPSVEVQDGARVEAEARRARRLGCTGKLSIHPRQLDAIRSAFTPSADAIERARRILGAGTVGAGQVDGQMVDRPVLERARRLLLAAGLEPEEASS